MVEQGDVNKSMEIFDARCVELQGIADVREGAAQAIVKMAIENLNPENFQIAVDLQNQSRLLERAVTDAEWLDALSTHISSPKIVLRIWDEKNEMTRERIEQEQGVSENQT